MLLHHVEERPEVYSVAHERDTIIGMGRDMSAEETLEWLDSLEGEALEKALKSIKPPLEDELRELLDKRINLSVEKIIRNEGMFEADDEDPAKPKEK